jgi:uncharacterized protein YdhG (YjbR/CyaY superfamily)
MKADAVEFRNIDEYITHCPEEIRGDLYLLWKTIKEAAPDAMEGIGYQMPVFKQNGVLVYFAGYKNHIGFYPGVAGVEVFKDEITGYKTSKGTIQFPVGQPLPVELITKIVRFRVEQNLAKTKKKAVKK